MTRDGFGSDRQPAAMDDDRLPGLVRATAADWALPPQRLDRTTWHDLVAVPRAGRARGRLPRIAIPLVGAVAVTVALAFSAVWLDGTRPSAIGGRWRRPARPPPAT